MTPQASLPPDAQARQKMLAQLHNASKPSPSAKTLDKLPRGKPASATRSS